MFISMMWNQDEIASRRPVKGDLVRDTNGEHWRVREAGMKYYICQSLDNPKLEQWFKHGTVHKVEAPVTPAISPVPAPESDPLTETVGKSSIPDTSVLFL